MTDRPALYRLMSWLSPNYPVGGFAYSHGLEQAVTAGRVADAVGLAEWIETVLLWGTGRVDGVLFRETHDAMTAEDWDRLADCVELGDAMQPTAEIALESGAQGAAFLSSTRAVWPAPMLAQIEGRIVYSISVAAACAAHGIDTRDGLHAYFHAIAANLVSAGVRLIPLGQTEGQRVLAELELVVSGAVDQGLSVDIEDIGSAAPVIDLASMHHETQYTRLFRS